MKLGIFSLRPYRVNLRRSSRRECSVSSDIRLRTFPRSFLEHVLEHSLKENSLDGFQGVKYLIEIVLSQNHPRCQGTQVALLRQGRLKSGMWIAKVTNDASEEMCFNQGLKYICV